MTRIRDCNHAHVAFWEVFAFKLPELRPRKFLDAITGIDLSRGRYMRFHRAESAFFVFIFVVLAAGLVTLHAYDYLQSSAGQFTPSRYQ